MDDNENILDYQKMNFSPFSPQFAGLGGNAVNQFTTTKFTQNINSSNGQVVGVVSGTDGGVHYVRPVDGNNHFSGQLTTNSSSNLVDHQSPALITLPITMPGAKPGDAQQTVHIQVLNPNPIQHQTQKFQMGQMQIPIQNFQPGGTTVLTVAYSPQDGKFLPNHGFPEGMTVVAALQPQDLQLLAQAQAQAQVAQVQHAQAQAQAQAQAVQMANNQHSISQTNGDDDTKSQDDSVTVKQEPSDWENASVNQSQSEYSEYLSQSSIPINLQPFLKFNPSSIKFEPEISITSPKQNLDSSVEMKEQENEETSTSKQKRKRKAKKKPPKEKPPKPGQVLIATAFDGTTLFCCPECQMAYPEKENLEQHLSVHKIERRYICDICGAGLKRKEHLERHKSGHNPDRPYICSVCMKGFKRKEHLNLHFVIHSGEKNEICGECGKGFYRKDHLRKHANSHAAKRLKEEMNARAGLATGSNKLNNSKNENNIMSESMTLSVNQDDSSQQQQVQHLNSEMQLQTNNIIDNNGAMRTIQTNTQAAISLSTVYVPTSDNTTLPVQIQIPQIVTTSCADGTTTSTMVMPNLCSSIESQSNNNTSNTIPTT